MDEADSVAEEGGEVDLAAGAVLEEEEGEGGVDLLVAAVCPLEKSF